MSAWDQSSCRRDGLTEWEDGGEDGRPKAFRGGLPVATGNITVGRGKETRTGPDDKNEGRRDRSRAIRVTRAIQERTGILEGREETAMYV